MRLLAIETTDRAGSLALLEKGKILDTCNLDSSLRSAQSLAPAIVEILRKAGWKPDEVQGVCVATGPGSFTGLRVGVSTAKLFAYAINAEVMGVHTLETISAQAPDSIQDLWVVMDAQRDQVFASRFIRLNGNERSWEGRTLLLDNEVWLNSISPMSAVSGPGLQKLAPRVPAGVTIVDSTLWNPLASTIGLIGWRAYESGRRDNLNSLRPHYFRRSAAEEKLIESK